MPGSPGNASASIRDGVGRGPRRLGRGRCDPLRCVEHGRHQSGDRRIAAEQPLRRAPEGVRRVSRRACGANARWRSAPPRPCSRQLSEDGRALGRVAESAERVERVAEREDQLGLVERILVVAVRRVGREAGCVPPARSRRAPARPTDAPAATAGPSAARTFSRYGRRASAEPSAVGAPLRATRRDRRPRRSAPGRGRVRGTRDARPARARPPGPRSASVPEQAARSPSWSPTRSRAGYCRCAQTSVVVPFVSLDQTTNRFVAARDASLGWRRSHARPHPLLRRTGADMAFETLASDFYGFENLLTDREKEFLADLRAYLESEVKPIVNEYWERRSSRARSSTDCTATGAIGLGFAGDRAVRELRRVPRLGGAGARAHRRIGEHLRRRAERARARRDRSLRLGRAARGMAAEARERRGARRVRPHRAALRLGLGPGAPDGRDPRRRQLESSTARSAGSATRPSATSP